MDIKIDKIKFKIQVTGNDLGFFNIYVSYKRIHGIVTILVGIISIILSIVAFKDKNIQNGIIFIFIALIFFIYFPIILLKRGKRNVKINPTFQNPLYFFLDNDGVTVAQNKQCSKIDWHVFYKAVEVPWAIYLFSTNKMAFIWPKNQLGEKELDNIRYFITSNMISSKCKGMK